MNPGTVKADSQFDVLLYLVIGAIWLIAKIVGAKNEAKSRKASREVRKQAAARTVQAGPVAPRPTPRPAPEPEASPDEELRRFLRELSGGAAVEEPAEPGETFEETTPPVVVRPAVPPPAAPPPVPVARPVPPRPPPRRPAPPVVQARTYERKPAPAVPKPAPGFSFDAIPAMTRSSLSYSAAMSLVAGGSDRRGRRRKVCSGATLREAFVWKTLLDTPIALRPPGQGV